MSWKPPPASSAPTPGQGEANVPLSTAFTSSDNPPWLANSSGDGINTQGE